VKLELTSTKINKVVGRKELAFKIEEASTPSRADVRRDIAVLMRTDLDNVYVCELKTKAGTRKITGVAHVYDDAETALKVEPKYIITRNKGKEAVKLEATVLEEEKK
jgi:small subunit ribosomal protein S24e